MVKHVNFTREEIWRDKGEIKAHGSLLQRLGGQWEAQCVTCAPVCEGRPSLLSAERDVGRLEHSHSAGAERYKCF